MVFNQSVQSLQASIGNKMGICSASSDNKEYTILFEGIPADCYQVTIVADGKLITAEPLTILSPLGDKESDPF